MIFGVIGGPKFVFQSTEPSLTSKAQTLPLAALEHRVKAFQSDSGRGRRSTARNQLIDVIVSAKEVGVRAIKDGDLHGVILAQLSLQAVEFSHEAEIKQIDRRLIDSDPRYAAGDLDAKKIKL